MPSGQCGPSCRCSGWRTCPAETGTPAHLRIGNQCIRRCARVKMRREAPAGVDIRQDQHRHLCAGRTAAGLVHRPFRAVPWRDALIIGPERDAPANAAAVSAALTPADPTSMSAPRRDRWPRVRAPRGVSIGREAAPWPPRWNQAIAPHCVWSRRVTSGSGLLPWRNQIVSHRIGGTNLNHSVHIQGGEQWACCGPRP
jgi:hypothetical protein